MIVRIRSKRDGYRRCGVAHRKAATDHPASRFSEDELARLQADPVLTVELLAGAPADPAGDGSPSADGSGSSDQAEAADKPRNARPKRQQTGNGAKRDAKGAAQPGATDAPGSDGA